MHRSLISGRAVGILTASILVRQWRAYCGLLETISSPTKVRDDSNGISHTPAHVDPNLRPVAYGISTSPFWVSDNGAGCDALRCRRRCAIFGRVHPAQQSRRPRLITRVRQPESCSTSLRLTGLPNFRSRQKRKGFNGCGEFLFATEMGRFSAGTVMYLPAVIRIRPP